MKNLKLQAIIYGIISGITNFVGWFITMTPEQQNSTIAPIIAIVPVHWQSPIGMFLKAVGAITAVYATMKAAQSGPKTLPIIFACLLFTGCESTKTFLASPAGQTTEKLALNILLAAASNYANDRKMDTAWAVPLALNSVSQLVATSTSNEEAAKVIQNTVTNFSNDTTSKSVARKLANAFVAANPQTPEARQETVVALATGASAGLTISTLP